MGKKKPEPLLPVHARHTHKRSRRKGSCMRLVIMVAILCSIGYAAFATRYIGTSKARKDARDGLVRTQLERKSGVSGGGVQRDGRSLKADPSAPGSRQRDLVTDPSRKRADLTSDFPIADDGAYDDVVARDRRAGAGGSGAGAGQGTVQSPAATTEARAQRPQVSIHAHGDTQPHAAPVERHSQSPQAQPQHHGSQEPRAQRHVTAGPTETDREAEVRREAEVKAPSLAVGSRIESDRSVEERAHNVAEPGAKPVPTSVIEPESHRPVTQHAPIDVVHVEPDAHQSQRGTGDVRAPVLTGPVETDSSQHHAPVKAPEDGPVHAPVRAVEHQTVTPAHPDTTAPVVRAPNTETAPNRNPNAKGLYALEAVDIDGKVRPLSEFAGKVTLVVNVASACGYTDENYKGLMKTYEKYRNHNFEILGFPCNQFGKQEPGSEAEIKGFCTSRYHVAFPMFSKVDVNGPTTHPVYQFLKRELPESEGGGGGTGPGKDLIWNFQKILVNHEGRPVKLFYQSWDQGAVEQEIYRLLHEARAAKTTSR